MEIAEIARKALEVLDQDGWCKGAAEYHPRIVTSAGEWRLKAEYRVGSHCIGGAVCKAQTGNPSVWRNADPEVFEAVAGVIVAQYPELACVLLSKNLGSSSRGMWELVIAGFNDHADTSEEDVRRVLEKLVVS